MCCCCCVGTQWSGRSTRSAQAQKVQIEIIIIISEKKVSSCCLLLCQSPTGPFLVKTTTDTMMMILFLCIVTERDRISTLRKYNRNTLIIFSRRLGFFSSLWMMIQSDFFLLSKVSHNHFWLRRNLITISISKEGFFFWLRVHR